MADAQKYLDPQVLSKLERLDLKARLIVEGYISGLHKSPFHGFSVEFAQHREYAPGDDLRRIDWKVYGRSDRYYIKEYEEETNLVSYVLLDISESMRYASGDVSKLEYGCYIAASLVYLMLLQRDSVGLVLFDDDVRRLISDSSNPGHRRQLLDALENIRPEGRTELGQVLHDMAGQVRRRGLIILISDLFGDVDRLLAGLKHLRHRRHEVIVFHVLDDYELTFPFRELTLFKGMEGYPQLFTEPRALREQYLAELGKHTDRVRTECLGSRIDYQRLSTAERLDVALSSYLATRMALTRR
ncbi:MAG: DUF58 domain-containing protein [Candidatus Brocadiia bacterium]